MVMGVVLRRRRASPVLGLKPARMGLRPKA